MMLSRFRVAALSGALITIVTVGGCTGSDPLNPSTTTFTLEVQTVNSGGRFDSQFFKITQILLSPVDPQADEASGVNPLGIIDPRNFTEINAAVEGFQFSVPVTLGTGSYRLDQILLNNFNYRDFDPTSTATCEEFIQVYKPVLQAPVTLRNFGDVIFTVENGGQNRLTITVDAQKFFDAYQSGFTCIPQGVLGCNAAWCLFLPGGNPVFNQTELNAQSSEFLEFQ